jgi:hypothetical protein
MKQFFFITLALTITLFSACNDDDDVNPIIFIGNPDGWMIQTVTSNFQAQADAAIASVTDEALMTAGLTRAEVTTIYNERVANVVNVDPCDQDDGLFFSADGATQLLRRFTFCPDGDLNVLDVFHAKSYTLNANATSLTFRDANGANGDLYDVGELSAANLRFGRTRSVSDTLVGTFMYNIEYSLSAN